MNIKYKTSVLLFHLLLIGISNLCWCQNFTKSSSEYIIKKCICNSNDAQTEDGCIKQTNLFVKIWDKATSTATDLDISTGDYAKIEPLVCPEHFVKENSFEHIFLSTEGKLLRTDNFETDLYCIEFVINKSGTKLMRNEACYPKPNIRSCCDAHEYINSSGKCTKIPDQNVVDNLIIFFNKFNRTKDPVNCINEDMDRELLNPTYDLLTFSHIFETFQQRTDGNFCFGMSGDENELYPAIAFCKSSTSSQTSLPKIPVCCHNDKQAYDLDNKECIDHEEPYEFPSNIEYSFGSAVNIEAKLNCTEYSLLKLYPSVSHFLFANGTLQTDSNNLPFHKYCLGKIIIGNSTEHSGLSCLIEKQEIACPWRWNIYNVCFIISSLFLIATLIVYLGVPDLRRRIGGMCLISELLALLVAQVTFLVLHDVQDFSENGCLAAGIIEMIFILASFFWLNIMCYDVWSTFRKFRPYSEKVFNWKTFSKYSLYGWGIPLFVGIVAIVLQKTDNILKPDFHPDIGCFFIDRNLSLQWFYIYGLVLILLLINTGFFIHLAFKLRSSYADSKQTFRGASGKNTRQDDENMRNIKLYGKLLIIMGLPWLIEVFTSFASKDVFCYIWFLDVVNALRGVFIFIIFVCKKSTRDMICKSWCPQKSSNENSSEPSRKTSTISLTQWLPSLRGGLTYKLNTPSPTTSMGTLKEEYHENVENRK